MKLPDQTERNREGLHTLQTVFEGGYVVANLAQVRSIGRAGPARFGGQQFCEGCPGALDPTRKHCFPADERTDEEMRIGKTAAFAGEAPDCKICP